MPSGLQWHTVVAVPAVDGIGAAIVQLVRRCTAYFRLLCPKCIINSNSLPDLLFIVLPIRVWTNHAERKPADLDVCLLPHHFRRRHPPMQLQTMSTTTAQRVAQYFDTMGYHL